MRRAVSSEVHLSLLTEILSMSFIRCLICKLCTILPNELDFRNGGELRLWSQGIRGFLRITKTNLLGYNEGNDGKRHSD